MSKKILAALLAVLMVVSLVPVTAFAAVSTELAVTVGTDGAVTVTNKTTSEAYTTTGTLKYALVASDPADTISSWDADTIDESTVESDLSATLAEFATNTKLTVSDNDKWLVVVDVSDTESKIVAAGSAKVTGITTDTEEPDTGKNIETLAVAVDAEGTIAVKNGETEYTGTSLTYYLVDTDKSNSIAVWETTTTKTDVEGNNELAATGTTTKPTLTSNDNGKFLVVVDFEEEKVVAAGQSEAINIPVKSSDATLATVLGLNITAGSEVGTAEAPKTARSCSHKQSYGIIKE